MTNPDFKMMREAEALHAFLNMVLLKVVDDERASGIIVVGAEGTLHKGIVLDIGEDVSGIQKGDLVYTAEIMELEDGIFATHFQEIIAYKRYE